MTLQATSLPEISVEMPQLTITEASQHFSDLIKSTTAKKQRTLITQNGYGIAVLLPFEDLALLQKLEDKLDYHEAIEALDEPGENISLEELKKELRLMHSTQFINNN
jgi:prevent-host-death family protein